jgi:hypothetical protein
MAIIPVTGLPVTHGCPRIPATIMTPAERIAKAFHESYERLAPSHGYETRKASAKSWAEVPEQNRRLMIATVQDLLDSGWIALPVADEGHG